MMQLSQLTAAEDSFWWELTAVYQQDNSSARPIRTGESKTEIKMIENDFHRDDIFHTNKRLKEKAGNLVDCKPKDFY